MAHDHGASGHSHDHTAGANVRMLGWALALTSLLLVAEVVGGFWFNSLALLSDAAHMLTDVAALVIALMAIKLGRRAADDSARSVIDDLKSWRRHSTPCCCSSSRFMCSPRQSNASAIRSRFNHRVC